MSKYTFKDRHIGPRNTEIEKMLSVMSYDSVEKLIEETIPSQIMLQEKLNLPDPLTESRYKEHIKSLAQKNKNYRSYIGMGYFNTILPGVIQRNILENPGWYTAYTPYQA
ncbi:MAG TPA: glycine dehydrogenase (aminomethyl-transferring), partial [Flavobacteriales bacterium]|nr:glycine dehydrogenase (aminomethyl-transferring) [Flavobacteriales bacterium]